MFALIAMIGFSATAQDVDSLPIEDADVIYVTATKRFLSDKLNAYVDAGTDTKFINLAPRRNYYLTHEGSNNRVEFNSQAAILSYFKDKGFKRVGWDSNLGIKRAGIWQGLLHWKALTKGNTIIFKKKSM